MAEETPFNADLKLAIAKRAADMTIVTLDAAGVPRDVQLEAIFMALGALIVRNVKPTHCLSVYNAGVSKLRETIKITMRTKSGEKKNASH